MNGKKAKKLRKQLGMSTENNKNPEYGVTKTVKKVVYFQDKAGQTSMQEVERQTLVNKSLYFYRKTKKEMKGK